LQARLVLDGVDRDSGSDLSCIGAQLGEGRVGGVELGGERGFLKGDLIFFVFFLWGGGLKKVESERFSILSPSVFLFLFLFLFLLFR